MRSGETRPAEGRSDGAGRPASDVGTGLIRVGAAIVGLSVLVSLWASPDRLASLPWVAIALAGVAAVFVTTGRWSGAAARLVTPRRLLWTFLDMGVLTLAVTLLTSRWPTYKIAWLNSVYAALPSMRSLPYAWAQDGLQPNQTGGFLAVMTAFAMAVAISSGAGRSARWLAAFLTMAGTVTVFLTGSRAALAGLVLAYLLVVLIRTSKWLWAWGAGLALVALGLLASGRLGAIAGFFLRDETLDTKLVARLDIWSSALQGIQDHFFTGIGLGTFNQIMPLRYPYQTVGLSFPVSQAHNLFLDVALAVGVPGLIGLIFVLVGSVDLGRRGLAHSGLTGVVSLGILSSIVAYLTFGITDSISLSIPTSIIIWVWASTLILLKKHPHGR